MLRKRRSRFRLVSANTPIPPRPVLCSSVQGIIDHCNNAGDCNDSASIQAMEAVPGTGAFVIESEVENDDDTAVEELFERVLHEDETFADEPVALEGHDFDVEIAEDTDNLMSLSVLDGASDIGMRRAHKVPLSLHAHDSRHFQAAQVYWKRSVA